MKKIIQNSKFIIQNFLTPIIFLIVACSTEPQTGSLSGNIYLEGEVYHSGITVALYDLAELDQDIVDINEEYPFIGVKISQMTEFDHRFGNMVKYTQTDANGYFKIKDIPTGRYNVVVIKDSFGFKYIYNVQINNGDNSLHASRSTLYASRSSDLTLFPETRISSNIDTATTWLSCHHYIIEDDIFVSGALTIKPGAVIRLNEGVKLTISGDLTAIGEENNFIWFTSNDGLDSLISLYPYIPYTFNRVELIGSLNKHVSLCKFDHAGTGLLNKVNGFSISDCIFRNSLCGFHSEGVDSTFCSNLLCEDITNEDGGIYFGSSVDSGNIKNNVCSNCVSGIKIYNHSNPEVKNNYIYNCKTGVDISFNSLPDVHNNEIYECETGVYTHAGSYLEIYRNEIQSYYGVVAYQCYAPNIISVNYNNLNCIYFAIQIKRYSYVCASDINAENNYFYTTSETEIQELIYDKNDVEGTNQQYYGIVNYIPFLTQEYYNAGIKED